MPAAQKDAASLRLAVALKRRRLAAEMTQSKLAERVGITEQYLRRLESGGNPSYAVLRALAHAFGIDVVTLIDEAEKAVIPDKRAKK